MKLGFAAHTEKTVMELIYYFAGYKTQNSQASANKPSVSELRFTEVIQFPLFPHIGEICSDSLDGMKRR
jgi:hypothetical protein